MLFNSMGFLIFFPIVVLIYFIIPRKIKNMWLLIASYYFYMCWNAKYALLLLTSTAITYMSGILLERAKGRFSYKKWIAAGSFFLNLGILFYFKYINFMLELLGQIFRAIHIELQVPAFDILLPVGISFYIFQALSYTMDVYRGEIYAEKNFFRYALFVSFFPQLVAGPIERSKNLLKQLAQPRRFEYDRVREGLLLMLWGYFLKLVVADRCAVLVNTVYGDYVSYHGFQLVLANVLFAFQIYGDFMGYSVIARGAAKVLGYELMENFSQPYLACTIKDFWRRWHISLSSWLRDYLYIPLGGSRRGKGIKYRNLLITFLASGLWHGADITFVFWGALHGLYQIIGEFIEPALSKCYRWLHVNTENFSWKCLRTLKTFVLVDIAWVFFRSDTLTGAFRILKQSLDWSNTGLLLNNGLYELGLNERNMSILLVALAALAVHSVMKELGINILERLSGQNAVFRYAVYWGAVLLITFSLDITGQEFLYFQF
ncbi:MBOAT family O-acyltransferase [Candidatus Merdisoma sp. JLR.KK006]|uniref:MBOAT family O-acyltransferase n=1 Tax=Candidatus Merdisoma sp. JLR.KK006 TaxID=3112626 RepID=UPI002FEE6768